MLRPIRNGGEEVPVIFHFNPVAMQTAPISIAHPPPRAVAGSPYDPAFVRSRVAKRRRGREIQTMLNESNTGVEDAWISYNATIPRERYNVTTHTEMGEYRVYDWLADRTTVIPINISIPARKTVDSYIAERRLDFSNGTLNNEKVFESVKARFLFSLHQPKFYCYLGMPTAYGYQWDVERGATPDQLTIIDKRFLDHLPEAQRTLQLTYGMLILPGFNEVIWAHGCVTEHSRILLEAMLGAPYPGESKYKDVNRHMDPRSGARWFIGQDSVGYWNVKDLYLRTGYRLPRAAASNPGFRILSWIGNEVSASYYRQSDLAVEYGEPWQLLHGTDESINLSSLFIPNGSLGVAEDVQREMREADKDDTVISRTVTHRESNIRGQADDESISSSRSSSRQGKCLLSSVHWRFLPNRAKATNHRIWCSCQARRSLKKSSKNVGGWAVVAARVGK